ncbi:MAG: DUF2264 domain-containing protein [Salinivirgaceae bacterium]|nr:DUF2264 domain-containing protein [Salinivirgaceae bacterium]
MSTNLLEAKNTKGAKERAYMVKTLTRIANPVLSALSNNELKKRLPIESKSSVEDRSQYIYLEAFGRTLAGMAPWLELGADETSEGQIREKYIQMAQKCIDNATNPSAPDFMNFNKGGQPLVDAAFFSEALLRAPNQLWKPLSDQTKKNVIVALKSARIAKVADCNWLLFQAIVEAALLQFDGSCDTSTINYALKRHFEWYKGDGVYGDGPEFRWDYYNSFVIHPMLIEVLQVLNNNGFDYKDKYQTVLSRAVRYADIQERLISPEATFPPIGRSICYRFGAFHLLSKIARMEALTTGTKPAQVRYALYSVVKKQIEAKGTFDKNGWLTVGFSGHQPDLAEPYISTGSLYLCSQVFLVLGLPANNEFWQGADSDWTSKKIWQGEDMPADHAK